jgi:hypothetical protein
MRRGAGSSVPRSLFETDAAASSLSERAVDGGTAQPAAAESMSEKAGPFGPQAFFPIDQAVGLALAVLVRPQKSRLLRPATELMSEKRPQASFSN